MKKLFASAVREVSDGLFGNPVLEMCVYTTQSKSLMRLLTCRFEVVVGKTFVVAMIMLNRDAVLVRELFEREFSLDCILRREGGHEMHVLQPRKMVHKDCGGLVSLFGKCPFELCNEAHLS